MTERVEGNWDGKTLCNSCGNAIPGNEYLTEVNAEGGYGLPRFLACDPCMASAEPGSKMAEIWERVKP